MAVAAMPEIRVISAAFTAFTNDNASPRRAQGKAVAAIKARSVKSPTCPSNARRSRLMEGPAVAMPITLLSDDLNAHLS